MANIWFALGVSAAALAGGGIWLVISGLIPGQIRLSDAFAVLGDVSPTDPAQSGPTLVTDSASRLENAGAWLYLHGRLPLPDTTARLLRLRGRSVGDYFVHKLVLAIAGLVAPQALVLALGPLLPRLGPLPVGFGLVAGLAGWFWPDIAMRRQQRETDLDAESALNTYFDLVLLERLANLSATQSLAAAARLSDAPVFAAIRGALEQARLEQRAPWAELHRLARQLDLPQIADLADVMRLDDQGAALAEVLASRVQELRDAHLTRERTAANQLSEKMTLWMSIPVIIFALTFLIPPLLRIAGSG